MMSCACCWGPVPAPSPRPHAPSFSHRTQVEGIRIVAERVVGATGLEVKNDPGVPLVYAGQCGAAGRGPHPGQGWSSSMRAPSFVSPLRV
jgi:hypothetical protein